jgi:hypothetical protein
MHISVFVIVGLILAGVVAMVLAHRAPPAGKFFVLVEGEPAVEFDSTEDAQRYCLHRAQDGRAYRIIEAVKVRQVKLEAVQA